MTPEPEFRTLHRAEAEATLAEARAGLAAPEARISPKWFYDTQGSRLFEAITELAEYETTRTEAALLRREQAGIAAAVRERLGTGLALVEPGAGNAEKAASLFDALQVRRYVAIDISVEFLRGALAGLQARHPGVRMAGLGLDFARGLELPPGWACGPALVFYPGSSIGNFTPDEARHWLRQLHRLSQGGALLIGVDLAKPAPRLQAAYDDALGLTAAFNLNALRHLNRMLGSDFDVRQWQHLVRVEPAAAAVPACVRMFLRAREALSVRWPGGERRFEAGECIHTEDAFKWERHDFEALLRDAGFVTVQRWTDEAAAYALLLAGAVEVVR